MTQRPDFSNRNCANCSGLLMRSEDHGNADDQCSLCNPHTLCACGYVKGQSIKHALKCPGDPPPSHAVRVVAVARSSMTTRKKPIQPDAPLKELIKLMRKLDPEQGIAARRNARAAVAAELRRVRAFVDATYPVIAAQSKPRKKRKTGQTKVNELLRKGWVDGQGAVPMLAEAKILPKIIETVGVKMVRVAGRPRKEKQTITRSWTLVPGWAVELLHHPKCTTTMLIKARKSVMFRKESLAEKRLWLGEMSNPKLLRLVTHA